MSTIDRTLQLDERPMRSRGLSWVRELLMIASIYGAYTLIRNRMGSNSFDPRTRLAAFRNAEWVISSERFLGIFHEVKVQQWFVDTPMMVFFNAYYGIAHFAFTIGVLLWLFFKRPANFKRWRTALLVATVAGLIGYSLFPLMPPRLINATGPYGGADLVTNELVDVQFTDTLRTIEAPWSFDSGAVDNLSNQFAAMPSLHVAWAAWCAAAIIACSRRRWRWLALAHPIITAIGTFSTANHFFLDAVGGLAVLAIGLWVAVQWERWSARRKSNGASPSPAERPQHAQHAQHPQHPGMAFERGSLIDV